MKSLRYLFYSLPLFLALGCSNGNRVEDKREEPVKKTSITVVDSFKDKSSLDLILDKARTSPEMMKDDLYELGLLYSKDKSESLSVANEASNAMEECAREIILFCYSATALHENKDKIKYYHTKSLEFKRIADSLR